MTVAASLAPTRCTLWPSLLKRHPALRVKLPLDDHLADLGGGRWDLAVRIAPRIANASVLARRLSPLPLLTLAAPAYLGKHFVPQTPDDLVQHRLIGVRLPATRWLMSWLYRTPDGTRRLQPDFALVLDGSDAMRTAMVLGTGIVQAGSEGTAALVAADLVTVLDTHAPPPWAVWMLHAPRLAGSALPAVMEAFVAAFRQRGNRRSVPRVTHAGNDQRRRRVAKLVIS